MLKNIPPLLTPDALHALASMGHGDEVAIVDANFPAARVAQGGGARLVQLAGATAPQVLKAVLQLLPLDDFVPDAAWTMQVVGNATAVPEPVAEFAAALQQASEKPAVTLERFDFYQRAEAAFVILRTGEQRKYGNILLRKGVIASDGPSAGE
ncbi:RbsD/FucU domain-containing protein [Polaromonas sp.]|uniref:RbsD/FucU family protein n=1 Tax=Polaromonas sp. TaxID=1869339 RepID=UPI00286BBC24|nr:RbsD/FucU domain-containing protein [Polaromonas sp.]